MAQQDIRGSTVCTTCYHLGMSHVSGFYCTAKGCSCGHERHSLRHQSCCQPCAEAAKKKDDEPLVKKTMSEPEPQLIGFGTPKTTSTYTSSWPDVKEFLDLEEKDLP